MEPTFTITDSVSRRFPDLDVRSFVVEETRIETESEQLEACKDDILAAFRSEHDRTDLSEDPLFDAYRAFFWDLDIDPTKTRPAAEALARRTLQGKPIPTINTFVDASNLASLTSKVPLAAFDRDMLGKELRLRFAEEGEPFRGIGMDDPTTLAGGELVIDDGNSLIAVYPYRNSADTKLTLDSTDAFVLVCGAPGVSGPVLDRASEMAKENVTQFCGGDVSGPS
jgi:DNA/RNA-binding domain of Phe-tRNA-synthetase-like protein